jgi:hypothetical protein
MWVWFVVWSISYRAGIVVTGWSSNALNACAELSAVSVIARRFELMPFAFDVATFVALGL